MAWLKGENSLCVKWRHNSLPDIVAHVPLRLITLIAPYLIVLCGDRNGTRKFVRMKPISWPFYRIDFITTNCICCNECYPMLGRSAMAGPTLDHHDIWGSCKLDTLHPFGQSALTPYCVASVHLPHVSRLLSDIDCFSGLKESLSPNKHRIG